MILAHLIQIASGLPSDSSALEISISALDRAITAREISSANWERWLPAFAFWVAIGVAIEIVVIIREFAEGRSAWHRATIRLPEKPHVPKLLWELLGATLVTVGVGLEFWGGAAIAQINGDLRSMNAQLRHESGQLVVLLTKEAGDAAVNSQLAIDKAKDAGLIADQAETTSQAAFDNSDRVKTELSASIQKAETALKNLNDVLGSVEQQVAIQGPRWKILEDHREELVKAVAPFPLQKLQIFTCGKPSSEEVKFAEHLKRVLRSPSGNWDAYFEARSSHSLWDVCGSARYPSPSSNLVWARDNGGLPSQAAEALVDELNNLGIETSKFSWDKAGQKYSGTALDIVDSPWKVMHDNPVLIAIVVIENPQSAPTQSNKKNGNHP